MSSNSTPEPQATPPDPNKISEWSEAPDYIGELEQALLRKEERIWKILTGEQKIVDGADNDLAISWLYKEARELIEGEQIHKILKRIWDTD